MKELSVIFPTSRINVPKDVERERETNSHRYKPKKMSTIEIAEEILRVISEYILRNRRKETKNKWDSASHAIPGILL